LGPSPRLRPTPAPRPGRAIQPPSLGPVAAVSQSCNLPRKHDSTAVT
jgi:hypothetical protein